MFQQSPNGNTYTFSNFPPALPASLHQMPPRSVEGAVARRSCQAVLALLPATQGISSLTTFGSLGLVCSYTECVMFHAGGEADREVKYRLQR